MTSLNRWVVLLDLTHHDVSIIGYVDYLAKILKPAHIQFVHAEARPDIPEALVPDMPDLPVQAAANAKDWLCKEVNRHFLTQVPHGCEVHEGHPLKALAVAPSLQEADLIIGGRKSKVNGSGLLLHQLVTQLDTSLLLVPEHVGPHLDRILVPTDFSEHSRRALTAATRLSAALKRGEKRLYLLHIYDGAEMYYERPSVKMLIGNAAQHEYQDLNSKLQQAFALQLDKEVKHFQQPGLHFFPLLRAQTPNQCNLGRHIIAAAEENQVDLIVMGARGQTEVEAFSLGSASEKVIRWDNNIPLLILKK